ncbi:peptidoglycan-binding domain-containing protein [Jannaschia sp. LMIT008]|uniref:peptidoglycan-binding domain-containing protein n=1 Tax=Jannaschia maritima TaxID=3032585 RepID=UPI0028118E7C|nr:peptidoglycan-binding domain-containing protein [Jannaschia sp. LMIT008]
MRGRIPALAVCASLTVSSAFAADGEGRFAIEGGGLLTCVDYLSAMEWRSPDVPAYGGWIEGYVTALNQQFDGIYDLTPWQTTESLLSLMSSICRQLPSDTRTAEALDRMVRLLLPDALREKSRVVALEGENDTAIAIYAAVLDQINDALRDKGHAIAQADGYFGRDTQAGLRAVQAEAGLTVTGMPDQRTLFVLLLDARPRPAVETATADGSGAPAGD